MKQNKPSKARAADLAELDRLYHTLRGQINALGLCVRAMQSGRLPQREMDEHARIIAQTSAQIKKLVDKLQRQEKKPADPRRASGGAA
jgi:hypothetical protein